MRTLMLTVVWYSVFTLLSALVTNVWQLAALRLLAGIGIGGEWAMGGTFVAEEWPEERRRAGAGFMHTATTWEFFWRRWPTTRLGATSATTRGE
jgi:MFS family permease